MPLCAGYGCMGGEGHLGTPSLSHCRLGWGLGQESLAPNCQPARGDSPTGTLGAARWAAWSPRASPREPEWDSAHSTPFSDRVNFRVLRAVFLSLLVIVFCVSKLFSTGMLSDQNSAHV